MNRAIFLLILFTCCDVCIAQVTPALVKDVTPGTTGTYFMRSRVFNGKLVFTAQSGAISDRTSQLWISDGTASGTFSLGAFDDSYSPYGFAVLNDKLFFVAADDISGNELRCTDGTVAGTRVVKDIQPGRMYGLGGIPVVLFNKMYFLAHGGTHVAEIWESDGTADGTKLFAYIDPPGGGGCNMSNPVVVNDKLYFTVSFGLGHMELWASDTTAFSAKKVAQLDGNDVRQFIVANEKLYFIVRTDSPTGNSSYGFWVSDGTKAGTFPLISGIWRIPDFAEMGGKLYFYGTTFSSAGIWATDGTVAGTLFVKAVGGSGCDVYQPGDISLTVFKNKLYFGCSGTVPYSNELWVSDGTPSGTYAMMSFSAPWLVGGGLHPRQLTATSNYLYFKAWDDSTQTVDLWRTDGTIKGTRKIIKEGARRTLGTQICAPLSSLVELVDSTIFYVAEYDTAHVGNELYRVTAFPPVETDAPDTTNDPQDSVHIFLKYYPNPTSGDLLINVVFDQPTIYSVGIASLDGKTDKQLEKARYADAGIHTLKYSLHDMPAGIYIVRFITSKTTVVAKVVVVH